MKKIFTLFAAMLLAVTVNAEVINITNKTANSLQSALNSALTGDIIEMAAGTYSESGNYLAFTGKEITVRAAEGAEVIIKTVCPVRLKEGAKAEFINVKFDCSTIGSYDYVIVAADDTDNKRVVLRGCEFYGWAKEKAMIEATSSRRLASITIDSCYFHNCMKSIVFVENTGSIDLSITNSTFANITTSASFSAGVIDSRATAGSVRVDHCTFYNVEAMNTDYAAIGKIKLPSGAVVSNCIFALSAPGASTNRTIRDKVTAKNCLVYNYTTDSHYGMQGDVTIVDCIIDQDPLFADAANGNFTLAVTSPAHEAGVGGTHLGDPRWWPASWQPAEVIPVASIALDHDALTLDVNETAFLHATVLPVDATDPSVTWTSKNTSIATVTNGAVKGIAAGEVMIIAKAGDKADTCMVTISDAIPSTDFASPYFLKGTKAALSGNIFVNEADSLHYEDNTVAGTATWKINVTAPCFINATANFKTGSASGSKLRVVILDSEDAQVGDSLMQNYYEHDGDLAFTGSIALPKAGIYTVKLVNIEPWSSAKLRGITLTKADDVRTMYFKPGVWDTNNGGDAVKFAIWCFNGAVEDSWSEFMTLVDGKTDIYSTVIGASYNKVIFVRLNGSLDEPAWGTDKAYNQTSEELEPIPSGKNLMLITDWSAGSWKEYKETLGDGWYLIGKFDNVEEWTIDKLSAEKKFTLNSGHEFMITTELLVGDEFKAGYVYYDEITDIKPAGENYIVDADHAGTDKTIYFNEAGEGGDDWFAHTFYIEKNSGTSLDNVLDTEKTVKVIENGQLVIIKNGVRYNVLGTVIK